MAVLQKEPKFELSFIIGGFFIYIGLLLFIVCLWILGLRTVGFTHDILSECFKWGIWVYVSVLTMGILGFFIQLLRWLVWSVTVPNWQKIRIRGMEKIK